MEKADKLTWNETVAYISRVCGGELSAADVSALFGGDRKYLNRTRVELNELIKNDFGQLGLEFNFNN